MSTKRWIGNAVPVVQVWSMTIASNDVATAYSVAINGKRIAVPGATGGSSATALALAAALAGSSIPEFQEVGWAATGASVIGTGKTAGKPFVASASATGGTGTLSGVGNTVACTGPNFLDNSQNWDTGSLPVAGDDVYVENSAIDILYNLSALQTVALNSFNVAATFTGSIGLLQNAGKYQEYRGTGLMLDAARVNIGYGPGAASPRLRISSVSATVTAISVSNTGVSNEAGLPVFCWDGTPALGSSMQVLRGSVGIGAIPGHTGSLLNLEIGYINNVQSDSAVLVGPGSGAENWLVAGGAIVHQGNDFVGTLQISGGTLTVFGACACPQFIINGGTLFWNSTGLLGGTTNYISGKGTLDFSQDMQPKTFVSGGKIYASKGAVINDPASVLSVPGGYLMIVPQSCSIADLNLNFGYGRAIQV